MRSAEGFSTVLRRLRIALSTAAVSILLLPASAQAAFHRWDISEIYSNCDGTVQFIEFQTTAFNQHRLATHTLTSNSSSFVFPTNLPSQATANRRFLVATAAFAGLGGPSPDYTLPDGFIDASGDTVTLVLADSVTFASLPTDGILSADRFGGQAPNSPENFAGATASIDGGSCGIIRRLFPLGNAGDRHGAGLIEETDGPDGTPLGRPYFIFRIPQDVSEGMVCEGARVTFIADDRGQRAAGVVAPTGPDCSCVPPECGGGL